MGQYDLENILDGHPVRDMLRSGAGGEKLGIVLEGGGMRGVVVAGAALALEQLGLRDSFRAFYGASAGAVSAAYFAAGQASWGASVFYDDLTTKDFFSWRRPGAPMNLHFLFEEVLRHRKPLDAEAALQKKLRVFASRSPRGELVGWSDFSGRDDLMGALRASTTLPFFAGDPFLYRGEHFFDAGVHTSVPWKEALQDGCTHLVVLLSRPFSSPRPRVSFLEQFFTRNVFARQYPDLLPTLLRRVESYNEDIRLLRERAREDKKILIIAPLPGTRPVASFERRREPLLQGARSGAEATYRILFGSSPHFYEMLVASEREGRPLLRSRPRRRWWFF